MLQHKLIRLLQSFERREMTRFREFAESPYFNKHEAVRGLVQHLSAVFPQFNEENCGRAPLFQQLFPGQEHDQQKLAVVFTYTLRLLERFLAVEEFARDPVGSSPFLLEKLREKQQLQHFERSLRKAERQVEQQTKRDSSWYLHRYHLATASDQYFNTVAQRRRDASLQEKQAYLNQFFLAVKLRDACELAVRRRILKIEPTPDPLADRVLETAESWPEAWWQEPAINLYYRLYRMIEKGQPAYYHEALRHLRQQQHQLPDEELKNIYNYLQNYCIQRINAGDADFLKEIFQLYQAQLKHGLLLEEGYLSEWHYKNIVTTGLRLQELEWVYNFIESFREHLPEEARDNAYRFNLAAYYYAAEHHNKVLELLTQVEYSDLRYSLGAKALLLRTYYDLEEYEALFSLVDSFKQYLIRNKLMADDRRLGYHNLFKLTRRAALLRCNQGYYSSNKYQKELQRLKSDMEAAKAVFNKGWLAEKVREL